MKRLLLLISFTFLFLYSFTQTDVQRDNRVSPILKQALTSKSGSYIYGRTGTAGFINIAVLNQSSHTLCWFTCHGRLFDSTKLTDREFKQVSSKQLDPFVLYQNICDKYLADIAAAKDIYRVYGDIQLLDKLNDNYRALFAMETVQASKTRLQKLIAIENVRKKILTQLAYMNCGSPFGLHDAPLYKISKEQAGEMIQTKDSTVYYNIDPTSAVAKISLYKKSAGQLYIQNRFSEIIDSVALQPEKYDLLQKEKADVFLLYRGWLEMQWQGTLSAIRRQSAGLYNQVGIQDEKADEGLYSQLNAIAEKINQLNSPESKSLEQAVYDTYKNETSEINYIPLLGIGYSLTQARGQKEYELTNHLGNVLATVSDKKIGVPSSSNSSLIDHYEPDIVSAQDYYPFGMLQPGRSYLSPNGDKYRYGFNGKENDNEVKGESNQQDYGMRVYDPRLGRFLSVDPITNKYPELTPYQFASNRPVDGIDQDGLEYMKTIPTFDYTENRTWSDYVGAADNGVISVVNMLPTTWNGIVNTYKSIKGKTYGADLKADAQQMWNSIKGAANKVANEPLKTLTSPEALELVVSTYVGAKVLPGGGAKGNLLGAMKSLLSNIKFSANLLPGTEVAGFSAGNWASRFAFQFGKCIEYASAFKNQFATAVEKAGGSLKTFEVNIGKNALIGTPEYQLANNGLHRYVEVTLGDDVKIYDNFHPKGISKSEYMQKIAGFTSDGKLIEGEQLLKGAKEVTNGK